MKAKRTVKDKHMLDAECIRFFIEARQKTNAVGQLQQVLTAPRDFAKRYSLRISPNVEDRLTKLGQFKESCGFSKDDPINKEVIHFYNQVVIDGRYIQKWTVDPAGVAKLLKIKVSNKVIRRILDMRFSEIIDTSYITDPGPIKQNAFWIVVVIIVIILVFVPANSAYNFADIVCDPRSKDKV
jgi:hypothetical protein